MTTDPRSLVRAGKDVVRRLECLTSAGNVQDVNSNQHGHILQSSNTSSDKQLTTLDNWITCSPQSCLLLSPVRPSPLHRRSPVGPPSLPVSSLHTFVHHRGCVCP